MHLFTYSQAISKKWCVQRIGVYKASKGLFTLYILCVLLNYESYDYLT